MEVIHIFDIMKQMKYTYDSGEMHLLAAKHKISLYYSNSGKTISCKKDGTDIENCNYTVVQRMLKDLTENERYKIELLNPHSSDWKKIHIDEHELTQMIEMVAAQLKLKTHLLGYTYFCEALLDVCRKHIGGKVVNIEKTLKLIAKSRGVQFESLRCSIRAAVMSYSITDNKFDLEIKEYFINQWYSVRIFVRNFSHYLLDYIIEKERSKI